MQTNNDLIDFVWGVHPDDRNERVLMALSMLDWDSIEESLKRSAITASIGLSEPSACEQMAYIILEARRDQRDAYSE